MNIFGFGPGKKILKKKMKEMKKIKNQVTNLMKNNKKFLK
jgi:hypothetical protein